MCCCRASARERHRPQFRAHPTRADPAEWIQALASALRAREACLLPACHRAASIETRLSPCGPPASVPPRSVLHAILFRSLGRGGKICRRIGSQFAPTRITDDEVARRACGRASASVPRGPALHGARAARKVPEFAATPVDPQLPQTTVAKMWRGMAAAARTRRAREGVTRNMRAPRAQPEGSDCDSTLPPDARPGTLTSRPRLPCGRSWPVMASSWRRHGVFMEPS
jgi:hypothetical protein